MGWNMLVLEATGRLAAVGIDSPASDARELAEHVAGERLAVAAGPTPEQEKAYRGLVARRCAREPLQHVTGTMYFRFLTLACTPEAFIVRPETEMVAGEAIDAAREALDERGAATVVDLCTGSGAIAIAVATEVPRAEVIGVEKSPGALALAQRNNAEYGGRVRLVEGDARVALREEDGGVDVVVANPPYVSPHLRLSPEVEADPAMPLWGGGPEGLDMPRAVVARAARLLRPGGVLVMEHAENQAKALRDAAWTRGFSLARTGADLTGRPRWLWARMPPAELIGRRADRPVGLS